VAALALSRCAVWVLRRLRLWPPPSNTVVLKLEGDRGEMLLPVVVRNVLDVQTRILGDHTPTFFVVVDYWGGESAFRADRVLELRRLARAPARGLAAVFAGEAE